MLKPSAESDGQMWIRRNLQKWFISETKRAEKFKSGLKMSRLSKGVLYEKKFILTASKRLLQLIKTLIPATRRVKMSQIQINQ